MSNSIGLVEVSRPDGTWLVEGDMLRQLIRSYTSAELFLKNYDEKPLPETKGETEWWEFSVFEWFAPEVKMVEMNMPKVKSEIVETTDRRLYNILMSKNKPMATTKNELRQYIAQGKRDKALFRSMTSNLQARNNSAISESIAKYDVAIEGAKLVRDTSIDTLVVGATVATGGTAGAVATIAAGNGVLKGLANYQDTSNVGSAMITGTVGAITTMLKIPADKMPKGAEKLGTEIVVVFLESVGDVGSDLVTGKPIGEALTSATIKQVSNIGISSVADKIKIESQLKNLIVNRNGKTVVLSPVKAMATDYGTATAQKLTETGLNSVLRAATSSKSEADSAVFSTANLSDDTSLLDYVIQRSG